MEFLAYVKGIKADVAKKEVTISFTVTMDEESMATAEELAHFVGGDAGAVELKVMPYQRSFLSKTEVKITKPNQ